MPQKKHKKTSSLPTFTPTSPPFPSTPQLASQLAALEARGSSGGGDEEALRSSWILRIKAACLKALDSSRLLATEAELLAHGASLSPVDAARSAAEHDAGAAQRGGEMRAAMRGLAAAAAAAPRSANGQSGAERASGAGVGAAAASDRERFAAGVFRPSHILPTMTVEQFGEAEMERAARAARAAAAAAGEAAREAAARLGGGRALVEEAEEEAAVAKARAWDEFKARGGNGRGGFDAFRAKYRTT